MAFRETHKGENIMKLSSVLKKKWLCALLLILITFVLLAAFRNEALFPSDEEEIFVKGQAIASGIDLYSEIGSQHMPVMYYIAAVFSLLGVQSLVAFRLCFYLLMAVLWGLCYWRYSDKLGKAALVFYPVIYIILMAYVDLGYTILGEQLQGIGMAILFFELLLFQRERVLRMGNCVMISLAILISFGSAFVALFAVFAVGLTVLCMELRTCWEKKLNPGKSFAYLVSGYWKLILMAALPFVILLGYYWATNSLRAFYGWAYQLNREIYPKYLGGGYGDGILKSLFNGIANFATALQLGSLSVRSLSQLALLLCATLFLVQQHKQRKDPIFTAGLVFFLITTATRSVSNFHGMPAQALLAAMSALFLGDKLPLLREAQGGTVMKKGVVIFCVLAFSAPYLSLFPNLFDSGKVKKSEQATPSEIVDAITEEGERIGFGTTEYDILLDAGVLPATVTSGSCPWLWEWGGRQTMAELQEAPPRVYLFRPDHTTWGYVIGDYAPELAGFVAGNYTALTVLGYPTVHVLDDEFLQTLQAFDDSIVFATDDSTEVTPLFADVAASQTFTAARDGQISSVSVKVGTFVRTNACTLEVKLTDETDGETVTLALADCSTLADNLYNEISFEPQALEAGHTYTLSFASPDATQEHYIAIYRDSAGANVSSYASVDGQIQPYNLCVNIYEDR